MLHVFPNVSLGTFFDMNIAVCIVCLSLALLCDFFFVKQKTAYEMRISDWSSDVCSSDLSEVARPGDGHDRRQGASRLPRRAEGGRHREGHRHRRLLQDRKSVV